MLRGVTTDCGIQYLIQQEVEESGSAWIGGRDEPNSQLGPKKIDHEFPACPAYMKLETVLHLHIS